MFYTKFIFLKAEDGSAESFRRNPDIEATKSPDFDILLQKEKTKAKVIDIETGEIIDEENNDISSELQEERAKYREKIKQHGEILPNTHFATRYVKGLIDKLPMPSHAEFIFVDSESFLASYNRKAKIITISTGCIKQVTEIEGAPEDILATVIAHEIAHADTIEDYKKDPLEDPVDYWASTFDHGEELRADRVGAINASKAGYNPLLITKFLKKFGITSARLSLTHPESIARINHLLSIVGDDEQPLTNTTKELTPIPKNIVDWVNEPSTVYEEAESLMGASHEDLEKKLLNAKTLEEFSHVLEQQKHLEFAAGAKELLDEELVVDFYNNINIYYALDDLWFSRFNALKESKKAKAETKSFKKVLNEEYKPRLDDYRSPSLVNGVSIQDYIKAFNSNPLRRITHICAESALEAAPYRKSVKNYKLAADKNDQALENIKTYNDWIKKIIDEYKAIFDKYEKQMPKTQRVYYNLIKQAIETGEVPTLLFKNIHWNMSLDRAKEMQETSNKEKNEEGRRKNTPLSEYEYYDLDDPEVQTEFEEAIKLQIGFNSVPFPEKSEDVWDALNDLLKKEFGFNNKVANFFTAMILDKSDENGNTLQKTSKDFFMNEKEKEYMKNNNELWNEILDSMTKDELINLMEQLKRFEKAINKKVRYSSVRDLHKSLKISKQASPFDINSGFLFKFEYGADGTFNKGIIYQTMPAFKASIEWELYERGYEEDYFKESEERYDRYTELKGIHRSLKSPEDLNLDSNDWEILAESEVPHISEQAKVKAIDEYLKVDGDLEKLDPVYVKVLLKIDKVDRFFELSLYQWEKLFETNPWGNEKLQKILKHMIQEIESYRSSRSSSYNVESKNRSRISGWVLYGNYEKFLKKVYKLAQESPVSEYKTIATKYGPKLENQAFTHTEIVGIILEMKAEKDDKNRRKYINALIDLIDDGYEIDLHDFNDSCTLSNILDDLGRARYEDLDNLRKKISEQTNKNPKFSELMHFVNQCPKELKENVIQANDEEKVSEALVEYLTNQLSVNDRINFVKKNIKNSKLRSEYLQAIWAKLSEDDKNEYGRFFLRFLSLNDLCNVLAETPIQLRKEVEKQIRHDYQIAPNKYIIYLLREKNTVEVVQHILDTMEPSRIRDNYLLAIWEKLYGEEKDRVAEIIEKQFYTFIDDKPSRKNAAFNFLSESQRYYDRGFLEKQNDDILLRRHPFSTASGKQGRNFHGYDETSFDWDKQGSAKQGFMAKKLLKAEDQIFDENKSLDDKVTVVLGLVQDRSVVRDAYLEKLFLNHAEGASDEDIVKAGDLLIPLFSKESGLLPNINKIVLQSEINNNPEILKDFYACLDLITKYIPAPTLARNHFLELIERNAKLTPKQIKQLMELKISSEGKSETKSEDAEFSPVFLYSLLGEQNRQERAKTLLWLLDIKNEKPKQVLKWEKDYQGHLDSMPKIFSSMTPPEKLIIVKRMCEDAEGILDLQAVNEEEMPHAIKIQRQFLMSLANEIFKGDSKEMKFFKGIFIKILQEAKSTRGSQILSRFITLMVQNKKEGKVIDVPKMVTAMLAECGIIGKKVGQGIAGIPMIKEKYPKFAEALTTTQSSDTNIVPKHSLLDLADAEGLIDGNKGIKILNFDKYLGAASNKQACLVTVEITDPQYGEVGNTKQVVAKFKRPSAQKESNIEDDFELADAILDEIKSEHVPEGFLRGIEYALRKELVFKDEKEFSEKLKADIRGNYIARPYSVDVSDILFAGENVVFETLAEGLNLKILLLAIMIKKGMAN